MTKRFLLATLLGAFALSAQTTFPQVQVFPAAACYNSNNNLATPLVNIPNSGGGGFIARCRSGVQNVTGDLAVAPSVGDFAIVNYALPDDWKQDSQLTIKVFFGSGPAPLGGTAIWKISTACSPVNAGATDDPTWNVETALPFQTMSAGNLEFAQTGVTTLVTSSYNCTPGSTVLIKVALSGTESRIVRLNKISVAAVRQF